MEKRAGKRQLQKEATRERIIDTAMRVYVRQGFSAPTREIVKAAGVAHGTVFVHFPTRADLQREVLAQFAAEIGGRLHDISVADGSVEEMLCAHIAVLTEYEDFYRNLLLEQSLLPFDTRSLLASLHSVASLHFGTVAEQARQAGTIKDIPLHMLFNTWLGLLHYYLQNSELFAPGESVLKRRKTELVKTYIELIAKGE
ncbi:MAG: TetR/AcrR family transcriptional regulator [Oscillospiraceae bacterium]|jgi:AcrR family transcriptional regulator|nr:TetR/AcrR family transcriptional regulator [Oscillospiraceae bacterium]